MGHFFVDKPFYFEIFTLMPKIAKEGLLITLKENSIMQFVITYPEKLSSKDQYRQHLLMYKTKYIRTKQNKKTKKKWEMNIKLKSVFVCIKSFKDNIWTLHVILSLHFPSKMRHNYEAKCKPEKRILYVKQSWRLWLCRLQL